MSGRRTIAPAPRGPMAEWLRRGLQILARRFDSGSGLHLALVRAMSGGATRRDRQAADEIESAHPDGRGGELCGIPDLTGC